MDILHYAYRFNQSIDNQDLGKTYIAQVPIPGTRTQLFPG